MLRIAQLTVDRLESAQSRGRARSRGARTFTIVPQSLDLDAAGFASEFVKALRAFRPRRARVERARRRAYQPLVPSHRERQRFRRLCRRPDATPWSSLCVRQADALMLLARADGEVGRLGALCESARCEHGHAARGARAAP